MLDTIKKMLIEEGCIFDYARSCAKFIQYFPSQDMYREMVYNYKTIIDIHNTSLTDEEFKATMLLKPDTVNEFPNGTDGYNMWEETFNNRIVLPICIGLDRNSLYSLATCCQRKCEHCLHFEQCRVTGVFLQVGDNDTPEDCVWFLDKDLNTFHGSEQLLRQLIFGQVAECSTPELFYEKCKLLGLNTNMLHSARIKFAVFVESHGRFGIHRTSPVQFYDNINDANHYVDVVKKCAESDANNFGYPDTLMVNTEKNKVEISYNSKYGVQSRIIRIVGI